MDGPQQAGGSTDSKKDAGGPKRSNEEVPAAAAREETRLGPSRQLRRDPPGISQPHKAPLANDVQLSQPVPIPSKDGHAGGTARRIPDAALPPPNRPYSLPNVLSRKPSATMPGSLFPRSASLEPDPTPAVSRLNSARPSARRVLAAKSPLYQSIKEEEEEEADLPIKVPAAWSPGSPENPFVIEDDAPRNRQNVISSTEDALRFLNEQHPSPRSSPSPMAPPTPNASKSKLPEDDEEDVQPSMFKSKGKERAHDSVYDFLHSDISQEIRIRGTEDELLRAREEHLRKEQEQDADTTSALEERERDKERIRFLEAEVTRLRSQVSRVFRTERCYMSTDIASNSSRNNGIRPLLARLSLRLLLHPHHCPRRAAPSYHLSRSQASVKDLDPLRKPTPTPSYSLHGQHFGNKHRRLRHP